MPIPGILTKQGPEARIREVLEDPESFATTLVALVIDTYESEALEWSPETLRMEFRSDFRAEIPQHNLDKLFAAIVLLTSDDFYKRLPRFVQLCNVLTGSDLRPHVFDPADSFECAWGMTEALLLSPPEEDDEEPFAIEIRYYLGEVLTDEGIRTPPDLLRLAIYPTATGEAEFPGAQDPEGFNMEFDVQADKGKEIKAALQGRLRALVKQLESLPLRNGSTEDLVKKLREP